MKKPSLGTAWINNPSAPVVGLGRTLGDSLEDCGPTGLERTDLLVGFIIIIVGGWMCMMHV